MLVSGSVIPSHIMFDIVGDDLAFPMNKALDEGVIQGLVPHSVDGGVAILQHAYGSILCG
jgi:hypothetical protein